MIYLGDNGWGYCPKHLHPKREDCSQTYTKVGNRCIRVSPYKLSWHDAEMKCRSEGGHLADIMSAQQQQDLADHIKLKHEEKPYFEVDKWTTESQHHYWIGATVRCLV